MTLYVGGKEIQLLYFGRAHTTGDSIVFVPQDRIAYLSELFFCEEFPNMAQGYGVSWLRVLDCSPVLEADIFVPGHGPLPADPRKPGEPPTPATGARRHTRRHSERDRPRGERRSGGRRGEAPAV
jgi:glyoxylase-like metal-dependent hydrolase (beta-lactamase superfamily II)